jgi:hypothetical protein
MTVEQLSSLLAVAVLFILRLALPVTLTWLLGRVLRRVAPQPSQ